MRFNRCGECGCPSHKRHSTACSKYDHRTAMKTIVDNTLQFPDALRDIIRQHIAHLPAGTVGISRGSLWQLIVSDASKHAGAPRGTNAAWAARMVFNSVVSAAPFNKFVYE